jgi:hypothetical protein
MSVQGERAQRLAEIFREIFALSETSTSTRSKCEDIDESIKSFDTQGEMRVEKETDEQSA